MTTPGPTELVERLWARAIAETGEVSGMTPDQIAFACRVVDKALEHSAATIESQQRLIERMEPEAETYRQMHEIAQELGYPSILDALEALTPSKEDGDAR